MCVSDWRVARLIRCNLIAAITPPQTTFILLPNRQRVGVSICVTPALANVLIQVRNSDATITINETFAPFQFFHFTTKSHGELPTLRWNVTADGVDDVVSVIEYLLPEELLSIDPRQLVAR